MQERCFILWVWQNNCSGDLCTYPSFGSYKNHPNVTVLLLIQFTVIIYGLDVLVTTDLHDMMGRDVVVCIIALRAE